MTIPLELREALLCLAGYESGIFVRKPTPQDELSQDLPETNWHIDRAYAEAADLLHGQIGAYDRIAALAHDYYHIRNSIKHCVERDIYRSNVIDACARVLEEHLDGWTDLLVSIERRLVSRDPDLVSPDSESFSLIRIVAELETWAIPLKQIKQLTTLMIAVQDPEKPQDTTAVLLDTVRANTNTGFLAMAKVNAKLCNWAETAWKLSLRNWLVYGDLSPVEGDFLISEKPSTADKTAQPKFIIDPMLLPSFLSTTTAALIRDVGATVVRLRREPSLDHLARRQLLCARRHAAWIEALPVPLDPRQLTRCVRRIHKSLSLTVLAAIISAHQAAEALDVLADHCLIRNGEFARILCDKVDTEFRRPTSSGSGAPPDIRALRDSTVDTILVRAIEQLQALDDSDLRAIGESEAVVTPLSLRLQLAADEAPERPSSSGLPTLDALTRMFSSALFGVPVRITLSLEWPLSLMLAPRDLEAYNLAFHYLSGIRRAQTLLDDLWRTRRSDAGLATIGSSAKQQPGDDGGVVPKRAWLIAHATRQFLETVGAHFQRYPVRRYSALCHQHCQEIIHPIESDARLDDNSPEAVQRELDLALAGTLDKTDAPELWDDSAPEDAADEDDDEFDSMTTNTASSYNGPARLSEVLRRGLDALLIDLLLYRDGFTSPLASMLRQVDTLCSTVNHARRRAATLALDAADTPGTSPRDLWAQDEDMQAIQARLERISGSLATSRAAAVADLAAPDIANLDLKQPDDKAAVARARNLRRYRGDPRDIDTLLLALDTAVQPDTPDPEVQEHHASNQPNDAADKPNNLTMHDNNDHDDDDDDEPFEL